MTTVTAPPLNKIPAEPEFKDLLDQARKDIFLSLQCHHVCTIQSFDPARQVATATVNYKKTRYERQLDGTYTPVHLDYPPLVDCPVIFPGGGGGVLTFPVGPGDECLAIFNDRDMDNWFNGQPTAPNNTGRLHSFADAFLLVGPRSTPNAVINFNGSATELRTVDGTVKVSVSSSGVNVTAGAAKVTITNAAGQSLGSILQSLVTAVNNLVTQCAAITVTGVSSGGGTSGVPANAPAITALVTSLTTVATELTGLLS